MKTPAALALLLFLTACAAPGPYAYTTPAPGEAAFLAGGTMTAVALCKATEGEPEIIVELEQEPIGDSTDG